MNTATKQWLEAREARTLVRVDSLKVNQGGYTSTGWFVRYRRETGNASGAHIVFRIENGQEYTYAGCAEVIPEGAPMFFDCRKHDGNGLAADGLCPQCREEAS